MAASPASIGAYVSGSGMVETLEIPLPAPAVGQRLTRRSSRERGVGLEMRVDECRRARGREFRIEAPCGTDLDHGEAWNG